jgi:uncharacterized protein (DUF3820 family)
MPPRMKVTTEDDIITFGKYKGKSFGFIIDIKPDYIIWLASEGIVEFDAGILDCAEIASAINMPPEEYFWIGG